MKKLRRGQRFKNATTEAIRPTIITAISIRELEETQNSEGANQKRFEPIARATAARYCWAGKHPIRPHQSLDLEQQGIERREIPQGERAQKDPSWNKPVRRTLAGVEQPADNIAGARSIMSRSE